MSVSPKERRPWPMKWIVVAILVVIVPYTYLTLRYRKPGPAYEPAADMKHRATTARLLSAGYQRIALVVTRPAQPASVSIGRAPASSAAGGLPSSLRATLVEPPQLAGEILNVAATANASADATYPIQFTCTQPDNKQQLAGAELYVRRGEIVVVPSFEKLSGALLSRTRDTLALVTVPAGALKPGHYQVTLVGGQSSRAWTLDVK